MLHKQKFITKHVYIWLKIVEVETIIKTIYSNM